MSIPYHCKVIASVAYSSLFFILSAFISSDVFPQQAEAAAAAGPLRILSSNPRYFTDGSGKAIYLTGSHTWGNFQDESTEPPINFTAYLDFLEANNHNFIRLWRNHSVENGLYTTPTLYQRTGPGAALDGRPKYDVTKFNQEFFDRLRSRIIEAGNRGIYVSVMLFRGKSVEPENSWNGHPYHRSNNINGVDGDPNNDGLGLEVQQLSVSGITALQKAYVKKVIDTLNDLDNVLYEISNESRQTVGNTNWQYHFIDFIHSYEANKPKQHPVGMTMQSPYGTNEILFSSNADWISPNDVDGYRNDPPAASGKKVIIADIDHIWPQTFYDKERWAWKSFIRGLHPILMDWCPWYGNLIPDKLTCAEQDIMRAQMGQTLAHAERMTLASMAPSTSLCSTAYCLANPGKEYLVYQPGSGSFTVNLQAGTYNYSWFNPSTGSGVANGSLNASTGSHSFTPPFSGPAVLYLESSRGITPIDCHLNDYSTEPVHKPGFGVAYNTISSAKELLMKVTCGTDTASISLGNGLPTQVIYDQGHLWAGSQWLTVNLSGPERAYPGWFKGSANSTLSSLELAQTKYFVAYICTWAGSTWKCGCADSACNQGYWQLQPFRK
jgi:hypothetical protein